MRLPVIAFATLLAGCGGGSVDGGLPIPPAPLSTVYKSLGSVQCTGGGTTLAAIQKQLSDAGVTVFAASCGIDGLAHIAVCGADDGKIAIFDVPSAQVNAALALSFGNLASLPDAKKTPTC
jgi:hypothetical protein